MIRYVRMARACLVALVVLSAACGPIAYVNEVTRRAASSVEEARAAEAEKYAPYYWTRAIEYLVKARETAARADYQGANRYGRLATESAEKARAHAEVRKAKGQGPWTSPTEAK